MSALRPPPEADLVPGISSPLEFAVTQRDRNVVQMVEEALRRKRALLAFQPIVQARRFDRPAFWEGLIRLQDATGRIIPARDFMPSVETHEIGRQIDCLALELGFEALSEEPSLRLSINMSARSIGYPQWMHVLNRGLAADPTAAERLILEITESSAMLMPELVKVFMNEVSMKGVAFALDDFGAGYTAFRYLRDFDFDVLKIDGQFIQGIARNPDNQVLTKAIISLASHFEMFTVAELVETQEDAEYLVSVGVDCMQGYYFSAPTVSPWWLIDARRRNAG